MWWFVSFIQEWLSLTMTVGNPWQMINERLRDMSEKLRICIRTSYLNFFDVQNLKKRTVLTVLYVTGIDDSNPIVIWNFVSVSKIFYIICGEKVWNFSFHVKINRSMKEVNARGKLQFHKVKVWAENAARVVHAFIYKKKKEKNGYRETRG